MSLKLRAADEEDLRVFATCLQDAILPIADIDYLAEERRFLFVANRFRWENATDAPAGDARFDSAFERVHCAVAFDQVRRVQLRRIDRADRALLLNLLTLEVAPGPQVTLVCAGDRAIRLELAAIDARLEDLGEPWPTARRPEHPE